MVDYRGDDIRAMGLKGHQKIGRRFEAERDEMGGKLIQGPSCRNVIS